MSKHILFIAPESFPVNAAEAIVNVKLLKALTDEGYKIDLIAKKSKWENYPSTKSLNELGIHLNYYDCVEVDNRFNITTIWQHFLCYVKFGVVFKGAHWAIKVLNINEVKFSETKYDYILSKSAPSLLVANYLKKKYGFKWVASWNDPYPGVRYPAPYGRGSNAKLPWFETGVDEIMGNADFHIFPNERLKNYMLRYLKTTINRTVVIPHIADDCSVTNEEEDSNILRIVHSGNLSYPRNPINFITALSEFVKKNKDFSVFVDFIGRVDDNICSLVNELKLNNIVKFISPMNYDDSLASLKNYDVTLIIEADCEEGIFLPTKVGDYMQFKKTIFAMSPAIGVLNDLYSKDFIQYFAVVNDSKQILNELEKIANDFTFQKLKGSKYFDKYSAQNVVRQYKEIDTIF